MTQNKKIIGIIGGSELDDPKILTDFMVENASKVKQVLIKTIKLL